MGVEGVLIYMQLKFHKLPIEGIEELGQPLYFTDFGAAFVGDSRDLLKRMPSDYIDLIVTSPPFPLQRNKEYGRFSFEDKFVEWFMPFAVEVKRVLKKTGSFVIDLGGVYVKGRPVRSLYPYRLLIKLVDDLGFVLAQEFFWFNPSKLPSPIEWVNKRKIRVKDAVNIIWWLAKDDFPKANVEKVLIAFSKRMEQLLRLKERFYRPKKRPSGHEISDRFMKLTKKGAIPPNLLVIPNTKSTTRYLNACKKLGINPNPARFPEELPEFFIKFLTDENDIVLDIFAGSNTVGFVAEKLRRKWIAFEIEKKYLVASISRFISNEELEKIFNLISDLNKGEPLYIKTKRDGDITEFL